MARAPNEKINKAYELYKSGMKLVEIASQLDIPAGTVRRWKSTYKWDGERSNTKSERSQKKKNVVTKNKEPIADEVKSVLENSELNDKQRLFCLYYSRSFNATRSYQKAYGVGYITSCASGPRLLENVRVREQINKLKEQRYTKELLKPEDIFQKYMDIAFADVSDFVEFGQEELPLIVEGAQAKDEEGNPITYTRNYVSFRNSNEVDGTIISEVKKGKDGVSVKLNDRMKALQWLSDHMDLATEEQKARIDKLRADTNKINGVNTDIEDLSEIDGEIYGD